MAGQNPLGFNSKVAGSPGLTTTTVSKDGSLVSGGGTAWAQVTAAAVVKASATRVVRVSVIVAGSAGSLVLNDTTTTGGAATANEIATIPNASLTTGTVLLLDWPCANGLVVSAVPTGSTINISYV